MMSLYHAQFKNVHNTHMCSMHTTRGFMGGSMKSIWSFIRELFGRAQPEVPRHLQQDNLRISRQRFKVQVRNLTMGASSLSPQRRPSAYVNVHKIRVNEE